MGRKKLEQAGPPGSAARLRLELAAADRFISFVTWGVAAGMIVWSMLNATPYVADHLDPEWRSTAFVLPLVVDLAFIGALRADEIASRHNAGGGPWAAALRLFTGAASLFLNIGHAAEQSDLTGVFQHLITPGILVLLAEAGPAYRRRLARRLDEVEVQEAAKADAARAVQEQEQERRHLQEQADADRKAAQARAAADHERRQRREDEEFALELEEKRESARAARALDSRRLDLEEKRLTTTQQPVSPLAGMPASQRASEPPRTTTAPTLPPTPQTRPQSPAAAPTAAPGTTVVSEPTPALQRAVTAPAASVPAPARVVARIDAADPEPPRPATGPVKDWDRPGLPADCAPGRAPELLTDAQVTARMNYGLDQEWTQRRIGEFAGRSATVVNRHKARREVVA
ncbi:hypothetical protein [Streptomyces sp. NPDC093223]|uniref:hypothetical protein n=1 Tax=Streptomyces sp. NPDC093223 TaxID=3366033 RepID=UPI0038078719